MHRPALRFILVGALVLFLSGFIVLSIDIYRLLYQPLIQGPTHTTIIRIDKATSATSFSRALADEKLIRSGRVFAYFIRLQGLSQQLKAGVYQINTGESAQQFLYRVVAGDVLSESFRIIEGTTQHHVSHNLERAPYLAYKDSDWSVVAEDRSSAEGLLLADTYRYNAGTNATDLLKNAASNLQHYLDESWQQRAPGLPYKTPYEMLIVASIIEKETALAEERRLIAGVIVNRLRKYMPLQMDPTVIYGLGNDYSGKLTHENMQIDSPYNTYRYRGLPPTPIAMVGRDAIAAAAHPQPTEYLYFVAKGDGSHYFSATYEQQKQAIIRYLRKGT